MWHSITETVGNFWQETVAAIASIAAAVLIQVTIKVSKKMRRWVKYNSLPHQIDTALEVNGLLTEAKVLTGADRVYVYQFSNGKYYTNDVSQLNMTCTHEVVREGVTTLGPSKQEILVTQLPHLFFTLVKGDATLMSTDDLKDYHWKQMMRDRGTATFRAIPILDHKGRLDGWMGLDFLEAHEEVLAQISAHGEIDNSQTTLCVLAQRVGHALRR